jgi:hypothetical protein
MKSAGNDVPALGTAKAAFIGKGSRSLKNFQSVRLIIAEAVLLFGKR